MKIPQKFNINIFKVDGLKLIRIMFKKNPKNNLFNFYILNPIELKKMALKNYMNINQKRTNLEENKMK